MLTQKVCIENVWCSVDPWYSSNCGAPLNFICKKPVDSGGPITDEPPQDVTSYCPHGYYNIAEGTVGQHTYFNALFSCSCIL